MALLALHGVPTSPALWDPLRAALSARGGPDVEAPALTGTLAEQVAALRPRVRPDTVLLGHDLGGVVAASLAVERPCAGVLLAGTALGPYWAMVRLTAAPGLWRYFYARHGGRRFVAGAVHSSRREAALATFPGAEPLEMRRVALAMRPAPGLARRLGAARRVHLLWGREDRWYPPAVGRALARATGAPLQLLPGGHFGPWEEPDAWADAVMLALAGLPPTPRAGAPRARAPSP